MKFNAPKAGTWWVAVIVGLIGILMNYGVLNLGAISSFAFLFVVIGLGLLALATVLKGL